MMIRKGFSINDKNNFASKPTQTRPLKPNLTLDPLTLLMAVFTRLEVIFIAALATVQELCANAVMATVVEAAGLLLSHSRIVVQLAIGRIKLLTRRWTMLLRVDMWPNRRSLFLSLIALCLALVFLFKVIAITFATAVVELATTSLQRIVIPTSGVVLAGTQIGR